MKIEQIDLKAYGHFTNRRMLLDGAAPLHIVCGPNEAGKTTLWRAINGALFGIPETTRDGYLHGNPKLRVGLALSSRAGERLAVMRRKGRVNTLLSYDPKTGAELAETVPEDRLRDWLGGLSQGLFLAMFSLDHDALVRGGAALAQGKGDAGESLFEAGAGLGSIRALRSRLDGEAEALFKPRARNSAIYRTLSDYDETRRQAKRRHGATGGMERSQVGDGDGGKGLPDRPGRTASLCRRKPADWSGWRQSSPTSQRSNWRSSNWRNWPACPYCRRQRQAKGWPRSRKGAKPSLLSRRPRTACSSTRQTWRRSRSTTPSSPMPKPIEAIHHATTSLSRSTHSVSQGRGRDRNGTEQL
jgi:hypothetical protein